MFEILSALVGARLEWWWESGAADGILAKGTENGEQQPERRNKSLHAWNIRMGFTKYRCQGTVGIFIAFTSTQVEEGESEDVMILSSPYPLPLLHSSRSVPSSHSAPRMCRALPYKG